MSPACKQFIIIGLSTSVTKFTSTQLIMVKIFYSKPKDASFILTSEVYSFRFHPQPILWGKKKHCANLSSG